MENAPRVEIKYLIDYELTFTNLSEQNHQSNIENLNGDVNFKGKKGLHLCGGSVDENTGEVSGCILDGTYTFYKSTNASYNGFLGDCFSSNSYTFSTPQTITFKTKNPGTFIKSILVYFDSIANEFATELYFSNAKNAQGGTISKYTSNFRIKNDKTLFMYSFGQDSEITEITLNIAKWSKKKAFVKITRKTLSYRMCRLKFI